MMAETAETTGTQKISVSLPRGLVTKVRRRAGKGELSRYVAEAVEQRIELELAAEIVAEYEEKHGPIPDHVIEEIDAQWPDAQ